MPLPSTSPAVLDTTLDRLVAASTAWARRPPADKRADLAVLLQRTADAAAGWVEAACQAKGVPLGSTGEGEEWISGPWAFEAGLTATMRTLARIAAHEPVIAPNQIHALPDGRVAVHVFPSSLFDRLLLSGYSVEVRMLPEVTPTNLDQHTASFFRQENPTGGVSLVLGAGNIASIAPLDVLYELIAHGRVAICKMNPINEYLGPIFEQIFAPLIDVGFVAFVYGGADVGERLVRDPRVGKVHVTGSAATHDAIVFGSGPEGEGRKTRGEPLLDKPITSELGGVGPLIVVPGPWSEADLRYQAEHVATQKFHNSGFNCVAAQVLVLHQEWDQKDRFLALLKEIVAGLPGRPAYYPGADDRRAAAVKAHPQAEVVGAARTRIAAIPSDTPSHAFDTEFFGAVWAETTLSAPDPGAFLAAAVTFANERLMGTLGAQILIHPKTARDFAPAVEQAITDLRYGTIGINAWSGVGFLISTAPWGAHPGHVQTDIQSGTGVVHNAFLLEGTEKTVVRAPFAPFPRTLVQGQVHLSPKPAWFVTNRSSARLGRMLARFEAEPGFTKLPAIFAAALTG